MTECCKNQYLVWGDTGYLTCQNCGAEDTGSRGSEQDAKLYYTPPSDECFEDMKKACIEIWNHMSNDGGYRDEKIGRIKDIKNVGDNFMYMLAMFDINNQRHVTRWLNRETKDAVRERMLAGGNDPHYINNILV